MRVSIFAGALALTILAAGQASADGKCEPEALATKYPTLIGKTIRVAQSGEGAPFTFRDAEEFDKLIGLDADLVRATFACIGVKFEFKTGGWSGLLPSVIAGQSDLIIESYRPGTLERFGLTSLDELPPLDVDAAARVDEGRSAGIADA